mgnify:FL=1
MAETDSEFKVLQNAKANLAQAQESLLDAYINRIRELYHSSDGGIRDNLLRGLEDLVTNVPDLPSFDNGADDSPSFDGSVARKIRVKLGLSTADLAKELGYASVKGGSSQLNQVETGARKIAYPPRRNSMKYLLWLKAQGYNPYNL